MPVPSSAPHPPRPTAARRHGWIDVVLVAGGLAGCVATRSPIGVPLAVLGGAMPWVYWRTSHHDRRRELVNLVPDEIADAYWRVVTAARAPGVVDPASPIESADDVLLEVAAVLVGRPVQGGVLRRFVAVRVAFLTRLADELDDRATAWADAVAEIDAISPAQPPAEPNDRGDGPLVTVMLVVLSPFFVIWDLALGTGRAAVAFATGLGLRVRTVGRLIVRAGHAFAATGIQVLHRWSSFRAEVHRSTRRARGRFLAARLRLRLRMSRMRRRAL